MVEDKRIISKNDVVLIIALLLISVIGICIGVLIKKTGAYVKVSVDGDVVTTCPLDEDLEYRITTDNGYNILVIEDGYAYVTEADCRDKICVNHKKISNVGEAIICLPHKLVIEIVE